MQWISVALAVPGRPGKVCEDSAGALPDAVAVADGLGSTGQGARASALAVELSLGVVRDRVLAGARDAEVADALCHAYFTAVAGDRRVATTCLFAVASPARVVVGQLGDGLAVVLLSDGHVEVLASDRGDDFGNETDALPGGRPILRDFHPPSVAAVLLATDGVTEDLARDRLSEFVSGWTELVRRTPDEAAAALERFLTAWRTPNSNDDRSLALLVSATPVSATEELA